MPRQRVRDLLVVLTLVVAIVFVAVHWDLEALGALCVGFGAVILL